MSDALRTLMRAMPIDPAEADLYRERRQYAATVALSTLAPRDEIEVMIGVQAVAAFQAAAACWRLGMNHHLPNGDSVRHISAAATAARAFDTLVKALERRQARSMAAVDEPKDWSSIDPMGEMKRLADRVRRPERPLGRRSRGKAAPPAWPEAATSLVTAMREQERIETEQQDPDPAEVEGVRPDGSMIVPEDPTPEQEAYLSRRLGRGYRQEWEDSVAEGRPRVPKLRVVKPGDIIP